MKTANNHPPTSADWLLEWYCAPDLLEDLQGDLHERYYHRCKKYSPRKAAWLYFWDVIRFIKPYTLKRRRERMNPSLFFMFSNYLKTSFRSLKKQRLNSFISIFGLSLGFSAFILICLYVGDELKYDRYLPNADRIYRITISYTSGATSEHAAWSEPTVGRELQDRYPEIEAHTALVNEKITVKSEDKMFRESSFYFATPDYFKVFPYEFERGSASTSFKPGSVVLTTKAAYKYFGDNDPINQPLEIAGKSYEVTGILKDLPSHTDLKFDALVAKSDLQSYGWTFNYILFKDEEDARFFQHKLDRTFQETVQLEFDEYNTKGRYHMQALPEVHFGTQKLFDTQKSSKSNIYVFSTVALLILMIAGINYVNISLANAINRQAEVGIRKSIGAQNSQLKVQFLLESFMVCFLSLLIAIGIAVYCLHYMNLLTYKHIEWQGIFSPSLIVFLSVVTLILAIVTGGYPAFYLTAVRPIEILKGNLVLKGRTLLRKFLVVFQFSVSIVLVISTIFIFRQLELIQVKSPGYSKDQVLVLDVPGVQSTHGRLKNLKNKFLEYPFVTSASLVGFNSWPTADPRIDVYNVYLNHEWQTKPFNNIEVDADYVQLLGLHLVEGRTFTPEEVDGGYGVVLINKTTVDNMGWDNPLEQIIVDENGYEYRVIGVIDDFHFKSIRDQVEAMLIFPNDRYAEKLLIKMSTDQWFNSIGELENEWKASMPDQPLEFQFLDDYIQEQYKNEHAMKQIFTYFMIIAVSIACLGLFGLIALTTNQRLKEIGIRKVFGARTVHLWYMLSKDFVLLILISIGLATPLTIIGVSQWLEGFVYKTAISIDVFLMAGGLTLLVAVITMSWHIIKASHTNLSTILKDE